MSGENEPAAFMQNNFRFTLVTPTEVRIKHIDKQFLGLFWEVTPEIFSYNTYTLSLLFNYYLILCENNHQRGSQEYIETSIYQDGEPSSVLGFACARVLQASCIDLCFSFFVFDWMCIQKLPL